MNPQETIKSQLINDVKLDKGVTIKTIVHQSMLFDGMVECRVFCSDGKVYACLIENDDKITKFVFVPPNPQEK